MSISNMRFRRLIGQPLTTAQVAEERLNKTTALAVFSSDALSSTAYATEEILAVLAVAALATGGRSFYYVLPISLVIAILLWLITFSYRQTIHAYPSGGGAYIVAKENLGMYAGLTAARRSWLTIRSQSQYRSHRAWQRSHRRHRGHSLPGSQITAWLYA
jgi:amino acid transporter